MFFIISQAYDILVARSAYISQWLLYTQIMGIRNHGKSLHKQANYSDINQQLSLFSLKLTNLLICLLQEVLIFHNGYHIHKLWAYLNHGMF